MERVPWREELCKVTDVENCLFTSVVFVKLLKSCFAHISVNQRSLHGAVADLCEELASSISDFPKNTGRPVAQEKPDTMVSPTDSVPMTNPLLTRDRAQGDLLREHKQKIEDLHTRTSIHQSLLRRRFHGGLSRIQELPLSTVEQEDHTGKEAVKNLIHQFETHPNREALKADLRQKYTYNPVSEKVAGHDPQHGKRGVLRNV